MSASDEDIAREAFEVNAGLKDMLNVERMQTLLTALGACIALASDRKKALAQAIEVLTRGAEAVEKHEAGGAQ